MSKTVIVVGVDIETAGPKYSHPVLSVGDLTGKLLEQKKFNFKTEWFTKNEDGKVVSYGNFEPRCVDEFWHKMTQDIVDKCIHNPEAEEETVGWKNLADWLDSLEDRYPSETFKIKFATDNANQSNSLENRYSSEIKFATDNATFDVARIDYNLEKHVGRPPMRYSREGKYRGVVSADDMLDMLPEEEFKKAKERINSVVVHDHDCVNDSYNILLQYVEAVKYKVLHV